MIRHAVLTGEFPTFDDVAAWMPNAQAWRDRLREAEDQAPSVFTENAWAVGALQAAWSAITHTPVPAVDPQRHLPDALTTAIRIGHDTDTVAAIAGALLGARWGMSAVPEEWLKILHSWPGIDVSELERLARGLFRTTEQGMACEGSKSGVDPRGANPEGFHTRICQEGQLWSADVPRAAKKARVRRLALHWSVSFTQWATDLPRHPAPSS